MSRGALARAAGAVGAALLALALAVAAWPSASALRGAWAAEGMFSEAQGTAAEADPAAVEAAFALAREANEKARGPAEAAAAEAVSALDAEGAGVVSWLEVPRIGLKAPVYAEATDANLMSGAALAGISSLPVGGASTNTVVVGHTGMVGLQMFDRLDELEPGDEVLFWTLGERLRYEVRDSQVVEVARAEGMVGAVEGEDMATLVTCRPYGVNSHRLVVRAYRAEGGAPGTGPAGRSASAAAGESPGGIPVPAAALAVAAAAVAAALAAFALMARRRPWRLVRVTGAHPLAEGEVARLCRDAGPMRLDLARSGTLRLRLLGAESHGTWSRSDDDLGRVYRLELDGRDFGSYRLPEGPFTAREEGGELVIWSDGGASALRFERRRPRRDAGRRYGKDGSHER